MLKTQRERGTIHQSVCTMMFARLEFKVARRSRGLTNAIKSTFAFKLSQQLYLHFVLAFG